MSWYGKKRVTYDTLQDVQYHNGVEITSVMLHGVRFYRAYSLFNAAIPGIDKNRRSALIQKAVNLGRVRGGIIKVARYKASNAWFMSSWAIVAAGAEAQRKAGSGASGNASSDWYDFGSVFELAHVLDGMRASPTSWPVSVIDDFADANDFSNNADLDDMQEI